MITSTEDMIIISPDDMDADELRSGLTRVLGLDGEVADSLLIAAVRSLAATDAAAAAAMGVEAPSVEYPGTAFPVGVRDLHVVLTQALGLDYMDAGHVSGTREILEVVRNLAVFSAVLDEHAAGELTGIARPRMFGEDIFGTGTGYRISARRAGVRSCLSWSWEFLEEGRVRTSGGPCGSESAALYGAAGHRFSKVRPRGEYPRRETDELGILLRDRADAISRLGQLYLTPGRALV